MNIVPVVKDGEMEGGKKGGRGREGGKEGGREGGREGGARLCQPQHYILVADPASLEASLSLGEVYTMLQTSTQCRLDRASPHCHHKDRFIS